MNGAKNWVQYDFVLLRYSVCILKKSESLNISLPDDCIAQCASTSEREKCRVQKKSFLLMEGGN